VLEEQSGCIWVHFFVVDVLGICTGWYFTACIHCNQEIDRNFFSSQTPVNKKHEFKLRGVSECSLVRGKKWLTLGSCFPDFVMTFTNLVPPTHRFQCERGRKNVNSVLLRGVTSLRCNGYVSHG